MAGSSVKLELPVTSVQELTKNGGNHQIPERYIFSPTSEAVIHHPDLPKMESPMIDLQLLLDFSSPLGKQELHKLRSVLTSWGCFQLVNHGIESSLLDQVRQVCKEYFELPLEEKKKNSRTEEWFEGYGTDTVAQDKPINWNDRLHIRIYPVEQRNLKLWPQSPYFREILHKYTMEARQLQEVVLKAMARSLELEENKFSDYLGEDGMLFARMNLYPPCPCSDQVLGLRPHADGSVLTILLQDKEVQGLQVLKDDQWFQVPVLPHALFINVGDQLEIMSNGILKSPVHKVVIDKERERISVAVPSTVHPEKELGPLSELITNDRPRLYKNVKDYVATFFKYNASVERAISAARIQD